MGAELLGVDGKTDMTKPTIASRNFANATKNGSVAKVRSVGPSKNETSVLIEVYLVTTRLFWCYDIVLFQPICNSVRHQTGILLLNFPNFRDTVRSLYGPNTVCFIHAPLLMEGDSSSELSLTRTKRRKMFNTGRFKQVLRSIEENKLNHGV